MIGVVSAVHPHWLEQTLRYLVAGMATVTLLAAANSAMLGLSRLAYSLSTNRQIPSGLGRLHPQRSTPYVLIILAGVIAAGLAASEDLDFLVGIYAFGAMLAFTIAHLSICRLRYSEPDRDRPYKVPLSIRFRGGELPLPAAFGALVSAAGWLAVMVVHEPARYVGLGWMAAGILLYVIYRRADETSLLKRVTVSPQVLRAEHLPERDYGSILVPLFGTDLDDDIVQTAALLVAGEQTDEAAIDTATIEAIWIFVMPMSLPLDASLPEAQIKHARQVLARAKAVGEEYTGVQVATATVRTRRAGYAIVDEAKRRGVEAIVLGAEEPSRIRGGSRLGGRGGPLEGFVGDVTKYVVRKAGCRVIVTAPAAKDSAGRGRLASAPEPARPSSNLPAYGDLLAIRMFILIVGAGRVGSAVAKSTLAAGHEVSVLDEDPLSHERLDAGQRDSWEEAGGQFTLGTALETDALIQAGIERADVFIASTAGDNTNLIIAQIAQRRFGVEKVIVRVMDPARADWYGEQGMHTISPTKHAIEMFEATPWRRRRPSHVRDHRGGRQGRAQPRARADSQGQRGHPDRVLAAPLSGDRGRVRARRPVRRRDRAVGARARRHPARGPRHRRHRRRRGQHARLPGRQGEVPVRPDHRAREQPPQPRPFPAAGDPAGRLRHRPDPASDRARGAPLRARPPARPGRGAPGDHRARGQLRGARPSAKRSSRTSRCPRAA